jgi:hypothetical protein
MMCQGLVPWVPQIIGYGLITWIRPTPPAARRLGNYTPHIRDNPTTPGSRGGGGTCLKGTKLGSEPHHMGPEGFLGAEQWLRLLGFEGATPHEAPPDRV